MAKPEAPTAQTLKAIIRSSHPTFRNKADRIAFLVHAYMTADGYQLVSVGKQAEDQLSRASPQQSIPLQGWNEQDDVYAFGYVDAEGDRQKVLVQVLPMGDKALVHWMVHGMQDQQPRSVELDINEFTTDAEGTVEGFRNLDRFAATLHRALHSSQSTVGSLEGGTAAADAAASSSNPDKSTDHETQQPETRHRPSDYNRDDAATARTSVLQEGPPMRPEYQPGMPAVPVGAHDVVPPGFRPPGMGGMGGIPGGPGLGGMHMGPNDPLFMGGPIRPGGVPGGGLMPGQGRWDPIAPPGMPGFNPGDFQPGRPGNPRGGGGVHPDIMQPGPDYGDIV
jgi:proteasome inhibitor subunit 1 (PI31)